MLHKDVMRIHLVNTKALRILLTQQLELLLGSWLIKQFALE